MNSAHTCHATRLRASTHCDGTEWRKKPTTALCTSLRRIRGVEPHGSGTMTTPLSSLAVATLSVNNAGLADKKKDANGRTQMVASYGERRVPTTRLFTIVAPVDCTSINQSIN